MTGRSPSSRADAVGGLGAAAIVLTPYLTTGLAFRTALYVQGALLVALTLGLVAAGAARAGWWSRVRGSAGLVVAGVGLYAAAAAAGALVGLLRGNPEPALAGQLLSMGLLPLAAVAGFGLAGAGWVRSFAGGLGAVVATAALAHLAVWTATGGGDGGLGRRLFFANAVSVVGCALLGLLCLLVFAATAARRHTRLLAVVAACCVFVFIVGSGVRGLWLVTPPAVAVFGLLGLAPKRASRVGAALAVAGAVAIAAGVGFDRWLERPRTNRLPVAAPADLLPAAEGGVPSPAVAGAVSWQPAGDRCFRALGPPRPIAVRAGPIYRLRATLAGPRGGLGFVVLRWLDAGGQPVGREAVRATGGGGAAVVERWLSVPPATASVQVNVRCQPQPAGTWILLELRLEEIGPASLLPLLREHAYLKGRLASIGLLGEAGGLGADRSLDLRQRETARLLQLFVQAGWPARTFGHGLGAKFPLEAWGRDAAGRPVADPRPNYIHNFYAFLLFKLGLLGGGLVLAALVLWLAAAWGAARARPAGFARALAAATAAALAAYAIWSVASPEILNFRVAPLWGLLLAALVRAPAPEAPEPAPQPAS